jgi:hypothetical protein
MNSKNDWTDRLPELMEGYTEAEPEGLWDAVSAGVVPVKRRGAGAWWYAGGVLLAAASVAAVVLLWPVKPSTDISLVPGNIVAKTSAPEEDPAASGEVLSSSACLSETPPVCDGPLPLQPREAMAAEESTSPDARTETINEDVPTLELPDDKQQVQPGMETQAVETDKKQEVPKKDIPDQQTTESKPEKTVVQNRKGEEKISGPGTVEIRRPAVRRKPSSRVQFGFTATGLLSEAVSSSTTGIGIPSVPGTKAAGTTGSYSPSPSMFSRNKASTTDAWHSQSERFSVGVRLNLNYRWGIETGVVFSTLQSDFNSVAGNVRTDTERYIKYRGIPLYVTFNVFEWNRLSMYLNAGPMYEFTTATDTRATSYVSGVLSETKNDDTLYEDSKWSLNAGAGLQLGILNRSALFIQPGFSYHFKDSSTLETFYTEHPASYNLTFGYRILF